MSFWKTKTAILSVVIVLSSCVKDKYDFDNVSGSYSPEVATSLLNISIKADDILSAVDSNLLRENGDKLLEFVYSDTVYSLSLSEFIEIPDESINYEFQLDPLEIEDVAEQSTSLTLDTVAERAGQPFLGLYTSVEGGCGNPFPAFPSQNIGEIDLEIENAPFETATFSQGVLKLSIENNWLTEITNVELSLKRVSDGVSVDTLRYSSILPGQSLADSIDMQGKTIEDEMVGEFLSISSTGTIGNVCIDGKDSLVATISGRDLVVVSGTAVFPNQQVLNDTLTVDVELGNGEELETFILNDGELSISIDYQIQESAKLFIELPYVTKSGVSFIDSINVASGPTIVSETFNLSGYEFDLTRGGQGFNSIETRVRADVVSSGLVVPFDTSNVVIADVSMQNIDPLFIDGYFGNQTLTMDRDTLSFDIGSSDIFENMSFAEPTITLGFHNTFGIPMRISSLDLIMKNDTEEKILDATNVIPFDITKSNISSPSIPVTSEMVLNQNTNIAELINLWPNEVVTELEGGLNPNGREYNYAMDTSRMDVTLDLRMPLYGQISGFNITDTIDVGSSMANLFEKVVRASLRSNANNGFPLEALVKFYITDENYIILDSLESKDGVDVLISAATVDPNSGDVIENGKRQADLVADEDDVILLRDTKNKIIISATMNTANSGNDVKIYSTHEMEIKLGILAKLKFDLEDLENDENEE